MKALYIIEKDTERETVKRIFRKRVNDLAKGDEESANYIDDIIGYHEDDDLDAFYMTGHGVVYDFHDPEFTDNIVVYDFTAGKIHLMADTGDLFNLPSELFPF